MKTNLMILTALMLLNLNGCMYEKCGIKAKELEHGGYHVQVKWCIDPEYSQHKDNNETNTSSDSL